MARVSFLTRLLHRGIAALWVPNDWVALFVDELVAIADGAPYKAHTLQEAVVFWRQASPRQKRFMTQYFVSAVISLCVQAGHFATASGPLALAHDNLDRNRAIEAALESWLKTHQADLRAHLHVDEADVCKAAEDFTDILAPSLPDNIAERVFLALKYTFGLGRYKSGHLPARDLVVFFATARAAYQLFRHNEGLKVAAPTEENVLEYKREAIDGLIFQLVDAFEITRDHTKR